MIVDRELVVRVERAMARHGELTVDAFRERHPEAGARWMPFDGGGLVALGAGRYVNRGVGVGLGDTQPVELLDAVEAFYAEGGLAPSMETAPWASSELIDELRRRGYGVEWFRNVYAHDLLDLPIPDATPVTVVDDSLTPQWTAILGGAAAPGTTARAISDEMCQAMRRVSGAIDHIAFLDAEAAATGSITFVDDLAIFGGAATLEAARGRGLQHALLAHRLHLAAEAGCPLALVTAVPTGTSARNLLRAGFQLLYTQAVMTRTSTRT